MIIYPVHFSNIWASVDTKKFFKPFKTRTSKCRPSYLHINPINNILIFGATTSDLPSTPNGSYRPEEIKIASRITDLRNTYFWLLIKQLVVRRRGPHHQSMFTTSLWHSSIQSTLSESSADPHSCLCPLAVMGALELRLTWGTDHRWRCQPKNNHQHRQTGFCCFFSFWVDI